MSRSCQSATFSSAGIDRRAPCGRGRSGSRSAPGCACAASPTSPSGRARNIPPPRAPRCAAGGGSRSRAARSSEAITPSVAKNIAWRSRGITWVETGSTASGPASRRHAPRRAGRCWRRCRPRRRSRRSRSRRARRRAARGCGRTRHRPAASFRPKVIGSAWMPWLRPIVGVCLCSKARRFERGEQRVEVGEQDVGGAGELHREAGVEHVRAGHALVHEARLVADLLGDPGEEGDDVVLGHAPRSRRSRATSNSASFAYQIAAARFLRDHAELGQRVGGMRLDLEPDAEARLGRPDRGHLGAGIAGDHGGGPLGFRGAARLIDCGQGGTSEGRGCGSRRSPGAGAIERTIEDVRPAAPGASPARPASARRRAVSPTTRRGRSPSSAPPRCRPSAATSGATAAAGSIEVLFDDGRFFHRFDAEEAAPGRRPRLRPRRLPRPLRLPRAGRVGRRSGASPARARTTAMVSPLRPGDAGMMAVCLRPPPRARRLGRRGPRPRRAAPPTRTGSCTRCRPASPTPTRARPCTGHRARGFVVIKDDSPEKPDAWLIVPDPRSPGSRDPAVFRPPVADFWRYGWRPAPASSCRAPPDDRGLAINSKAGRGPEPPPHPHFLRAARGPRRRSRRRAIGPRWAAEPFFHFGKDVFNVRKVERPSSPSPFLRLAELPGARADMAEQSLAVIGSAGGGFYLVTDSTEPGVAAETEALLDETCAPETDR